MNEPNAWRTDAYVSRHSICRSFVEPALAIFVLADHGEALQGQHHCHGITKVGGERCKQAISDAGELGNRVVHCERDESDVSYQVLAKNYAITSRSGPRKRDRNLEKSF